MTHSVVPATAKPFKLPQLAIHCGYHKCLTVYITRVLRQLSHELGMKFQYLDRGQSVADDTDILYFPHSEPDLSQLPDFRGTHIVRDPRDLLVSAYLYHLRTDEEWCAKPNPHHIRLGDDESYQQRLNSLSREEGLLFELDNVSGAVIANMGRWQYNDDRFMELRFESVVGNEVQAFEQVFRWYGFSGEALQRALEIAEARSLAKLSKTSPDAGHARKGSRFGQWEDFFTPRVKTVFKERHAHVLTKLGYAENEDW